MIDKFDDSYSCCHCCCPISTAWLPALKRIDRKNSASASFDRGTVSITNLQAAAYGATMFGSAAMNNICARVNGPWFYTAQLIYMVWNAVNDPLFGWISDMAPGLTKRRIPAIKYGGPLWALVFALAWYDYDWEGKFGAFAAGMHFTLILCCYDSLLTLVELNHGALLADLSVTVEDRTRLSTATAIGAVLGSMSSFFGHLYWNSGTREGFVVFQRFSVVVGVFAAAGFTFSAAFLRSKADEKKEAAHAEATRELEPAAKPNLVTVARQMLRHRNFGIFTLMFDSRTKQVFECTLEKNFLSIFIDVLLNDVSKQTRSMILSTCFILPWLATIASGPLITRYGVYPIIRAAFAFKVCLSCVGLVLGHRQPAMTGLFAILTRVLTESVCRLAPLVLANLIDEDKVLHRRSKSMSAMLIGTSSLFTKPAESLAPMLGWFLVDRGGMLPARPSSDSGAGSEAAGAGEAESVRRSIFLCLVAGPLVIASIQSLLWTRFSLHGSLLKLLRECPALGKLKPGNERNEQEIQGAVETRDVEALAGTAPSSSSAADAAPGLKAA